MRKFQKAINICVYIGFTSINSIAQTVNTTPTTNPLPKPPIAPVSLCQNAIDVGFRLSPSGFIYSKDDLSDISDISVSYPQLKDLRLALSNKGIELIPIVVPLRGMLPEANEIPGHDYKKQQESYHKLILDLHKLGFKTPDLVNRINQTHLISNFFIKRDHHWTPYGASIAALEVASIIKQLPIYNSIPKSNYITTQTGIVNRPYEVQSRSIQSNSWLCGEKVHFPDEQFMTYQTKSAQETGLFDDLPAPQVVLVGTSMSRPEFNFGGFIEQETKINIADGGFINGGGVYLALQQYLLSKDFVKNLPKIILWEFAAVELQPNSINAIPITDNKIMSQIIPSISGICKGNVINSIGDKVTFNNLDKSRYIAIFNIDQAANTYQIDYFDKKQQKALIYKDELNIKIEDRSLMFAPIPKDADHIKPIVLTLPQNQKGFSAETCP